MQSKQSLSVYLITENIVWWYGKHNSGNAARGNSNEVYEKQTWMFGKVERFLDDEKSAWWEMQN